MRTKLNAVIGFLLFLNLSVSATVMRSYACDKDMTIRTESGTFDDDYLFLGYELQFSGQAQDLIFLGKRLTFKGKTDLGLISFGETVVLSGSSGNGIIAGAKDILIEGEIKSTSFAGCKTFNISDKGVVDGSLFVGCAKLIINGKLNGDLYTGAGEVQINNEINGNVTAYSGRIIFGEKGKINGNLTYSSKEKLSEKDASNVTGTVKFRKNFSCAKKDQAPYSKTARAIGFFIAAGLFISFIVTGLLLLFIPAFRKLDEKQPERAFWRTALWGLIPVFIYPAAIVVCFALVITIPFAFVLILAAVPLFFIAHIIGVTLIGKYLVSRFKWKIWKRHYQFLIGALATLILSFIPFINALAFIFITALGWGVYLSFLFKSDLTTAE